ncbi:hypothetical protein [Streptomyces sp. NPDC003832]
MTHPDQPLPRQLLVHPEVWPSLREWLTARGIELSEQQMPDHTLTTFVMIPSTVNNRPDGDQLRVYLRIFKQLPREAASDLAAAVTADPDMHGRQTALAQAALLVTVGHHLGWAAEVATP